MNVSELITLINQLSTDKTYLTLKERVAYLQYLNLANLELYEIASSGLALIQTSVDIFFDNTINAFKLPNDIFKLNAIFSNGKILTTVSLNSMQVMPKQHFCEVIPPSYYFIYNANLYCNLNNAISVVDPTDNTSKKCVTILYTPNPKTLVETVANSNTEIDTPIYPIPYHIFLVHGALYYFYFSNKIFMEKMSYIREIWEKDKTKLANFKNYGL